MQHQTLATDLWVPTSLDVIWNFASDPRNLSKLAPPQHPVRIDADARTENDARFVIELRPFGLPLPQKWVARIQDVVAEGDARQFVDTQESGPFAYWKHTHLFSAGAREVAGERSHSKVRAHEPGTWIRDRLEYAVPLGAAGRLANKLFVQAQLEKMFLFRRQKWHEMFG